MDYIDPLITIDPIDLRQNRSRLKPNVARLMLVGILGLALPLKNDHNGDYILANINKLKDSDAIKEATFNYYDRQARELAHRNDNERAIDQLETAYRIYPFTFLLYYIAILKLRTLGYPGIPRHPLEVAYRAHSATDLEKNSTDNNSIIAYENDMRRFVERSRIAISMLQTRSIAYKAHALQRLREVKKHLEENLRDTTSAMKNYYGIDLDYTHPTTTTCEQSRVIRHNFISNDGEEIACKLSIIRFDQVQQLLTIVNDTITELEAAPKQ